MHYYPDSPFHSHAPIGYKLCSSESNTRQACLNRFGEVLIVIWLCHKLLNEFIKSVPLGTWCMVSVKPDWNHLILYN